MNEKEFEFDEFIQQAAKAYDESIFLSIPEDGFLRIVKALDQEKE